MLTVQTILLLAAFVVTVVAGLGRAPLWVAVLLLVLIELVERLPAR